MHSWETGRDQFLRGWEFYVVGKEAEVSIDGSRGWELLITAGDTGVLVTTCGVAGEPMLGKLPKLLLICPVVREGTELRKTLGLRVTLNLPEPVLGTSVTANVPHRHKEHLDCGDTTKFENTDSQKLQAR
jgi:hypothetical protein